VKTHVPDIKAVEARAPFSFSAIRKVLYQWVDGLTGHSSC
jgi:hypothetical protein